VAYIYINTVYFSSCVAWKKEFCLLPRRGRAPVRSLIVPVGARDRAYFLAPSDFFFIDYIKIVLVSANCVMAAIASAMMSTGFGALLGDRPRQYWENRESRGLGFSGSVTGSSGCSKSQLAPYDLESGTL